MGSPRWWQPSAYRQSLYRQAGNVRWSQGRSHRRAPHRTDPWWKEEREGGLNIQFQRLFFHPCSLSVYSNYCAEIVMEGTLQRTPLKKKKYKNFMKKKKKKKKKKS